MRAQYRGCRYNGKRMRKHRAVIAESIGPERFRELCERKYVVHHINGDAYDNRIENLLVTTRSSHSRYHAMICERDVKGRFTRYEGEEV